MISQRNRTVIDIAKFGVNHRNSASANTKALRLAFIAAEAAKKQDGAVQMIWPTGTIDLAGDPFEIIKVMARYSEPDPKLHLGIGPFDTTLNFREPE